VANQCIVHAARHCGKLVDCSNFGERVSHKLDLAEKFVPIDLQEMHLH